jgi:hypothetical protein
MLLAPRMLHVAWLALLIALPGCAGSQWGTDTLYPPDVRTVYVPMIESTSFRRNQGERLTEAVIKEIERVTPFKVVNSPDADSVLTATLISETKRITIESPTDEGRQLEVNYSLQVMWADRKGDLIQQEIIASAPEMAVLTHTGSFTPEVGQSLATAQQEAIRRIARQVVGLMEVPW